MEEKKYLIAMDQRDAKLWCLNTATPIHSIEVITDASQLRGRSINPRRVYFTSRAERHCSEYMRIALSGAQEAFILGQAGTAKPREAGALPVEKDYTLSVMDPKGRVIFERKVTADQLRELPV